LRQSPLVLKKYKKIIASQPASTRRRV